MDIATSFVPAGHSSHRVQDTKRLNSKARELDNGDFLAIDDLLDFSNDDIGAPMEHCHNVVPSGSPSEIKFGYNLSVDRKNSQALSGWNTDGPGELCVPCDDLAELEWLSNFVEESFSSVGPPANVFVSSGYPRGSEGDDNHSGHKEHFQSTSPVSVLESSACSEKLCMSFSPEMSVPGRARSKRCRTGACFWNTRILSPDASASIQETSSTSTLTAADPESCDSEKFIYEQGSADSFATKKLCKSNQSCKSKKPGEEVRRCVHCATQRTPQWRAGPMGPKTLCNACGVRYKSGRLLPEYRPAASPTCIESVHSNSHRRVPEMRGRREQRWPAVQHSLPRARERGAVLKGRRTG